MKILYVATVVKLHIMEFHVPYLKKLKEMGWETAVAARNDYDDPNDCNIPFCDHYYDIPFERTPVRKENITAYYMLKQVIDEGHYDIVHCHTPVGAFIARLAAIDARKNGTKVFYTAHGFHFYKGAALKNWLIYYTVEKCLARLTDCLITINEEDYYRAQKFHARKIAYIPGVGIDTNKFRIKCDRDSKRKELGIRKDDFLILSVGELIPRKNQELILDALSRMKEIDEFKSVVFVLCGEGPLKEKLYRKACEEGIDSKVKFLGYRADIAEICNVSDLFVFTSRQEGLPVAVMEAMSCGLPVICTNIRGNNDLIEEKVNGRLVKFSAKDVERAIVDIMRASEMRKKYGEKSIEKIKEYDISKVIEMVKNFYMEETVT